MTQIPALRRLLPLALACACAGGTGPVEPADPIPGPGDWVRSVEADGLDREFLVHVPPSYDGSARLPLVLAFHGTPSDAAEIRRITDFDRFADQHGFVAVYPESSHGDWATGCLACASAADHARIDDVAFVRRVVQRLSSDLSIDRGRVVAVGFSNGALFVHHLACEAADLLAGAAIVGATLLDPAFVPPCRPSRAIPIALVHGDADPTFPPGGRVFGPGEESPRTISIDATLETWADLEGCFLATPPDPLPDVAADGTRVFLERRSGCDRGAEVRLWRIEGGGHTWPGSPVGFSRFLGPKSLDLDASSALIRYLVER